jgi:hypothetical protein
MLESSRSGDEAMGGCIQQGASGAQGPSNEESDTAIRRRRPHGRADGLQHLSEESLCTYGPTEIR